MTITIALAVGAVIGVLLGLLGGGGSILAVPALVYVLGLPVEQAIPMSLIVIGTASAVGALPKAKAVGCNGDLPGCSRRLVSPPRLWAARWAVTCRSR